MSIRYSRHQLRPLLFLIILKYDPKVDEPVGSRPVSRSNSRSAITIPDPQRIRQLKLLEDKVLLKLDWAKNQKTKTSLKKTVAFADEGNSNTNTDNILAQMDTMTIKMDAQYKELQSRAKKPTPDLDDDDIPILADKQSGRPSESLPSNTQPKPQGSNSKAYQPPQAQNEHVIAVFTRSGKSYNPLDNSNDQQNKSQNPTNFDSDDEDDEPTPQPKTQPTKPVVQKQRRLNPNMQEVVKKEIVKLLDTDIIYLIDDSPWGSPIQCV
ncbi:hypothetical protein Tco_1491266 [Tanacetum coccineum]